MFTHDERELYAKIIFFAKLFSRSQSFQHYHKKAPQYYAFIRLMKDTI
jgi:hypothetical protein